MPEEDQDEHAEQVDRPEDSRYYQVFDGEVPEEELKVTPPSTMPAELYGLKSHHLVARAQESP